MNLRADLQRDDIIFGYMAQGGVKLDPSRGIYIYDHCVDNKTYNLIADTCRTAGFEFGEKEFNEYVSILRGKDRRLCLNYDRCLPEADFLPGEILYLNAGMKDSRMLLKLSRETFMILDSNDVAEILSVVATTGDCEFEIGKSVNLYPTGKIGVSWIALVPPDRISRTVDCRNGRFYNSSTVDPDIAEIVNTVLVALQRNEYESKFEELVMSFARKGISSSVVMHLGDAFNKKYGFD